MKLLCRPLPMWPSLYVRPLNSLPVSHEETASGLRRLGREGSENLVRTLPPRLLAVVLLSGELACVVVWALTGALFALVVGLVAGVSVLLVALRSGG